MKTEFEHTLLVICRELYGTDHMSVQLSRPEPQFGDFATNAALQLAKKLGRNPRELAEEIAAKLREAEGVVSAEVAGPGFINFRVSDELLKKALNQPLEGTTDLKDKQVIVEYLDPNPFKELHIGHAYSGAIGDAVASLLESAGANVHRVTYQGDVGLHVAKALYAIKKRTNNDVAQLKSLPEDQHVRFLGESYAEGAKAYEEDDAAKKEINELNRQVYSLDDEKLKALYETGRGWSMDYFAAVYQTLDFTPFEKNYMERDSAESGLKTVQAHIDDGVFEKSDGAIIFKGEKHGLHTRVFINSAGLPTYEAKDLGLAPLKWADYHYDLSVIITANEQEQYFQVMLKALEQFEPELATRTRHIPHGMVRLSSGKMSSRTGVVLRALDVFDQVVQAVKKIAPDANDDMVRLSALGALKYAFLKNRIGSDVLFDIQESVSVEGNSGPYLQYAHARARSILRKAGEPKESDQNYDKAERTLAVKLTEFSEVVERARAELMPHHICTYLYELAQTFNRFYETSRIIGDPRENVRLQLAAKYADVLKSGLKLLKIPAPEKL